MNEQNPETVYACDPRSGKWVEVPEEVLLRYEGWGIGRFAGSRLFAAGFTPQMLSEFLDSRANNLIDNLGLNINIKPDISSIPTPKRRKQRRQLKPLKPWQKDVKGDARIPIHKGK